MNITNGHKNTINDGSLQIEVPADSVECSRCTAESREKALSLSVSTRNQQISKTRRLGLKRRCEGGKCVGRGRVRCNTGISKPSVGWERLQNFFNHQSCNPTSFTHLEKPDSCLEIRDCLLRTASMRSKGKLRGMFYLGTCRTSRCYTTGLQCAGGNVECFSVIWQVKLYLKHVPCVAHSC